MVLAMVRVYPKQSVCRIEQKLDAADSVPKLEGVANAD